MGLSRRQLIYKKRIKMALNYLLSPEFQIVNTAGNPATGGYLEVYISGSRERYYCASDFDGTLYPFHVPLDSLGSNVVLADESNAYDVYVYNRYGSLLMSRYNVHPRSGGGIGTGDITSSDDSIIVTQTANGVDLRTNSTPPSILRATASTLYADGQFTFAEAQRDGQNAIVDAQGKVIVNEGWWHYDATVRLRWNGPAQNETQSVSLYTQNASDSMTVDLSFAHSETVQVSGEYKALNDSTQFVLGVTNVPSGMVVELVDFGVHSIVGEGAGGKYNAGEGIVIDEPNRIISVDFDEVQAKLTAGDGITIDNEGVISVDESAVQEIFPVTYDSTTFQEIRTALIAGKLPVMFRNDGADLAIQVQRIPLHTFFNVGGSSGSSYAQFWSPYVYTSSSPSLPPYALFAVYSASYDFETHTTTWSTSYKYIAEQSDWAESDATKLTFIKNKPDLSVYATQTELTNGLATKQDVISDLATIRAGAAAGATAVQDANYVHTDNNFTDADATKLSGIESGAEVNVQANWAEADSNADSYIQNKPNNLVQDADYHHTDNNYTDADAAKLAGIAAGAEVNVQSDWTESDSSSDAYIQNKPAETTLAAGSNITITESGSTLTIAATAAPQQQADWTEADNTSVSYIQNKPANLVQDPSYVHTDNNFTNADVSKLSGIAAGAEVNVQSDWTEADNTADSYIQNKPSEKSLLAGSNITLTEAADSVTIAATVPAQQQANWTEADNTDPSYIQNKPSLATVATSGSYADLSNTPDLSLKEDVANKAQSINSSTTDYPSSKAVADYVNSSVSTNTAKFLGNFTLSDLSLTYPATDAQIETALDGYAFSPAPTNNDYVYVEIQDPLTPGVADVVKRFKFDSANWLYEYSLNNSSFTAAEIAAIDSGVTSTKVGNYDTHIADTTIHVTSTDKTTWNGKQDAISDIATIRSGAADGATAVQPGDLATVATSGLYSDLSGTPSLATVATSGDYDDLLNKPSIPAAQVQSNWTEADNTDPSYIQNKPSLAAVATSGLYSDLSGTPSLATVATSGDYDDLLNKPSIPAAQVQSNWTESDNTDPSYIQNKPTLATVATSGLYSDLSGTPTINNVPVVTSSDDSKVLKASYTGGVGSYSWEQESGGTVTDVEVDGVSVVSQGVASITMPTVDQTYNSASANAQSGVAVAGALANINQVPSSTSADEGKILTVDSNGDPEWATGGGGTQADWSEADPTAPSYIENKPVPKTLVAGTGITITESSTELTVASTNQLYNAGTGLTLNNATFAVDTSVVATQNDLSGYATLNDLPTIDQTYDASSANAQSGVAVASGISDAVAALPTNLSSAQIQALKEALGVDETVLFSGNKTNPDSGSATYTLSELPTNFQYIEVQYSANDNSWPANINGNCGVGTVRWDTTVYRAPNTTVWLLMNGNSSLTTMTAYTISANFHNIRTATWSVQGFLNAATSNAKWFHINKIVGIHRIAP